MRNARTHEPDVYCKKTGRTSGLDQRRFVDILVKESSTSARAIARLSAIANSPLLIRSVFTGEAFRARE